MIKRIVFCLVSMLFAGSVFSEDGWHESDINYYSVFYDGTIYVYLKTDIVKPTCNNLRTILFHPDNPNYDAVLSSVIMAYASEKRFGFYKGSNEKGERCFGDFHYGRAVRVRDR